MSTEEENDYKNLLHSIHSVNFTLEELKNFHDKYRTVDVSRLTYSKTGDSIIHVLARLGRSNLLEYIFSVWNLNIDLRNKDGKTALHEAAQFAQYGVVMLLVKLGSEINVIRRGDWTPLMLACTKTGEDALKIIELLLQNGAALNLRNKDGWTAFHMACREGDEIIFSRLISANKNNLSLKTKNGRTALHIAALHGHYNIVKTLLTYINPNEKDSSDNTVLHEATLSGNKNIVELLLSCGCDLYGVNNAGLNCLHLAASEGHINLVKYFVADCNIDVNLQSSTGLTALHFAARKKQTQVMHLLIQLGADATSEDNNQRQPKDYFIL